MAEGKTLQREPDRDENLVDFLLRDSEYLSPTVRVGYDEALLLQLPERLADGPAAHLQLLRYLFFDDAVAWFEAPVDDRGAEHIGDTVPR